MTEAGINKKILIILPTYNEVANITNIIDTIKSLNIGASVLTIDDNSPDGTGALLDKISRNDPAIHVIHRPQRMGLGTAYVEGFKYALKEGFDFILEMDADGQHRADYIMDMLDLCQEHDLVIGSRYKDGIRFLNITLPRVILATLANKYIKFITGMNIADSTSGFRCFRRRVLEAIDLDNIYSKGFAFQIEMAYKAWKKGFKIFEFPIIFYNRNYGFSKMSYRICCEALFIVLRLRLGVK